MSCWLAEPDQPIAMTFPSTGNEFSTPIRYTIWRKCRRDLVIVGAGIIGLEYASMFATLGVKVTLLDQRPVCWISWTVKLSRASASSCASLELSSG